jgi:fucose permease
MSGTDRSPVHQRKPGPGPVGISLGAFVALGLPDGTLGSAWPFVRSSFGQPLAALGLIQLAATLGYLLASGTSGRVTRRLGRGRFLVVATAAGSTAALGLAATPYWWTFVAAAGVLGAAGGALDAGINSFLAIGEATRTLNLVHGCYGVGATVGPILLTRLVIAGLGWDSAYLVVMALELVLVVAFFSTRGAWGEAPSSKEGASSPMADTPWHQEAADNSTPPGGRFVPGGVGEPTPGKLAMLSTPVVLSMAAFFVYTGVEVAAGQWSFTVFTGSRALGTATAGFLVAGYWGCLTLGRFGSALLGRRVSATGRLSASVAGMGCGAALFWWSPVTAVGAAGLLVRGVCLAAVFPTMVGLTPGWSGSQHAPTVIGWQLAAAGAGGALLSALAGVLMQSFGLDALGPFLGCASAALAALYVAIRRLAVHDPRAVELA